MSQIVKFGGFDFLVDKKAQVIKEHGLIDKLRNYFGEFMLDCYIQVHSNNSMELIMITSQFARYDSKHLEKMGLKFVIVEALKKNCLQILVREMKK